MIGKMKQQRRTHSYSVLNSKDEETRIDPGKKNPFNSLLHSNAFCLKISRIPLKNYFSITLLCIAYLTGDLQILHVRIPLDLYQNLSKF